MTRLVEKALDVHARVYIVITLALVVTYMALSAILDYPNGWFSWLWLAFLIPGSLGILLARDDYPQLMSGLTVIHANRVTTGWRAERKWRRDVENGVHYTITEECGCRRASLNAWPIMPICLYRIPCEEHLERDLARDILATS